MPLEELLKLYNYGGARQEHDVRENTRATPSPEPDNPRGKAGVPISKPKPGGVTLFAFLFYFNSLMDCQNKSFEVLRFHLTSL